MSKDISKIKQDIKPDTIMSCFSRKKTLLEALNEIVDYLKMVDGTLQEDANRFRSLENSIGEIINSIDNLRLTFFDQIHIIDNDIIDIRNNLEIIDDKVDILYPEIFTPTPVTIVNDTITDDYTRNLIQKRLPFFIIDEDAPIPFDYLCKAELIAIVNTGSLQLAFYCYQDMSNTSRYVMIRLNDWYIEKITNSKGEIYLLNWVNEILKLKAEVNEKT